MFPYFVLFGRTIGLYGVAAVSGLFVSVLFFYVQVKKKGVLFDDVLIMALVAVAGILVGGHLLFGITQFSRILSVFRNLSGSSFREAVSALADCFGGSVFYGGLFGSFIAGTIYLKHAKLSAEIRCCLADTYACTIPLFHVFGRIGCFLGGCCYGIESSVGFVAHGNTIVPELNDVRRFPVALAEAVCNMILFFVLWRALRSSRKPGRLIPYYGVSYSIVRFSLEFFRGDPIRGFLWGLSTSQWISIFFFAVCLIVLLFPGNRENEKTEMIQYGEKPDENKTQSV